MKVINFSVRVKMLIALTLILINGQNLIAQNTYYSYKDVHLWDGDWHHQRTWTSQINGTDIDEDPVTPQNGDRLIITSGTTIRLFGDVTTTQLHIEIQEGATLLLAQHQFENGLTSLAGKGTLIIDNNYYPTISGSHTFAEVGGGKLIIRLSANGNYKFPQALSAAHHFTLMATNNINATVGLGSNFSVAGNLYLQANAGSSLNFLLGEESTPITLDIKGNMEISSGVEMRTSTNNNIHNVNLAGNLLADGNLILSNSLQYNASNNGAAIFTFTGLSNTTVTGNGQRLDLYRLIVDKGNDQTYLLDIQHDKLRLFYRTDLSNGGSDPNPVINKALWIKNGTLKLGTGINIPELSSGGNDFFIPLNGALWIDGAEVHSTTPSGNPGNTGITLIGSLRITAGKLLTNKAAGIVYRGSGQIIIDGGEVNISQFRASTASGVHQASWIQTGGVVYVNGNGENSAAHPRFSLPLPSHSFSMTAGELNISNPNESNRGLVIGAAQGNINVTGGTLTLTIPSNRDFGFSSTAPFYNVVVNSLSASHNLIFSVNYTFEGHSITPQQLKVQNNLTLNNNAQFNTNGQDLHIGADFTIESGAKYISGENTTFFYNYENKDANIRLNNTSLTDAIEFHHVVFNKGGYFKYWFTGPNGNALNNTRNIIFNGNVQHLGARSEIYFNQFNTRSKGHITIQDFPNTRSIRWIGTILRLEGTTQQNLTVKGWYGTGPGRIILNNTQGARILQDADLENMTLELQNGVFDLGNYELTLYSPVAGGPFNKDRMIKTSGTAAAKGLKYRFRNIGAGQYLFPIGVDQKYTPFNLVISGTGSFAANNSFLSVTPVNTYHPDVSSNHQGNVLQYYWIVKTWDEGFTNLQFQYNFTYIESDLPSSVGNNKRRAYYINKWETPGNNSFGNPFGFNNFGFSSAHVTIGQNNSFSGQGNLNNHYYSTTSGTWNTNIWADEEGGTAKNNYQPTAGSIVTIMPGHHVTVTQNNRDINSLTIRNNASLNLGNTIDHKFESIRGQGTLRLSSSNVPKNTENNYDNITDFNSDTDRGTIEYYGTQPYTLSDQIVTYYNVTFREEGMKTLPNVDLTILNNLRIEGTSNTGKTFVRTNPYVTGTITISGQLQFPGTAGDYLNNRSYLILSATKAWEIIAKGYIASENRANIEVEMGGSVYTNHKIYAYSGINGRGKFDLYGDGQTTATLIVRGTGNNTFSDTQASANNPWKLYRLKIDKANVSDEVLIDHVLDFELKGSANGSEKPLEMINGTLILRNTQGDRSRKDITLTSGGANFKIPTTASMIVEGDNILRTAGNSNIELNGSLVLKNDAQALIMGTATDIIYGTSGSSVLEIHDQAQMVVSGQIRRSVENPGGILRYRQTGNSVVSIGVGTPNVVTRATFEVLNPGSEFRLDNTATFTIANSASTNFPALLLEPETHSLAGTINIGNSQTKSGQQLGVRTSIPLGNLNINATNAPVAYIHTHPILLMGNLNISNGAGFQSRGIDLEIKGNLTNHGNYVAQTTEKVSFTGGLHTISGNGNSQFNHMHVDAISGLNTDKAILVSGNFNMVRGTLNDKGNTITMGGNLTLNGLHISPIMSGGILLNAANTQEIRGLGTYGRITINKSDQHQAVTFNPIIINNLLALNSGILNIGSNRLTLNENALLTSPSTFNNMRMIRTGGGMGDGGIRKYFSQNDVNAGSFVFPVGTKEYYAGLEIIDFTNFSPGRHITVYPVQEYHPTIVAGIESSDPNRVLQYYWGLESNLQGSETFSGKLIFHFDDTMIEGNIDNYYTAQLRPAQDDTWAKLIEGVNKGNRTILFNHNPAVNADILNGFYTAGEENAIPSNVSRFVAQQSGNWEASNTWVDGIVPPSGVIAEIPYGRTLTITENMKRVYKTILNGNLIVEPNTTFHNLGMVEGNGTLELRGTGEDNPINLPAGRWENYMDCGSQSTIVFGGIGGRLPISRSNYNNLRISGTGYKVMPFISNMAICGQLSIEDQSILITRDDQVFEISGNLAIANTAGIIANNTRAHFIFNGSSHQSIIGDFTSAASGGSNALYRVRIQNHQSVSILGNGLEITNRLYLDQGKLINNNSLLKLSNPEISALANYSNSNFIEGHLTRTLPATSTGKFVFPVAQNGKARFVSVQPHESVAGVWTAWYFNQSPDNAPIAMMSASVHESVKRVSNSEYWSVEGPPGGKAYISIQWGPESAISIEPEDLETMLLAEWSNNQWVSRGMSNIHTTGNGFGSLTSDLVSFSKKYFTIASSDAENPLPIELLSFTARPDNDAVVLQWATASEINNRFFTIERSTNGNDFEIVTVIASKAENGNSNIVLSYSTLDLNPMSGLNYYRLKQTDFDGSFEYSDIIVINFQPSITDEVSFKLFPNPNKGNHFNIILNGLNSFQDLHFQIVDLFGKQIFADKYHSDGNGNFVANIDTRSNIPQGVYLVIISGTKGRFTTRMVVY